MMPQYKKYPTFPRPVVDCSDDLKAGRHAVQADAAEVDINNIIKRIQKGATPPQLGGQPFYGDVSEFSDLGDAFMKIQEANELFMSYPAQLRERFDNDPVKLVEFLSDPSNLKEAVELGLALKRPDPEPEAPAAPAPVAPSAPPVAPPVAPPAQKPS